MLAQPEFQQPSGDERVKRLRLRKIYIALRIPRIKAEIAAIAARKNTIRESGGETSKDTVEEMIYSNQHVLALRNELQSLDQERKSVLQGLRAMRQQETEKGPRPELP